MISSTTEHDTLRLAASGPGSAARRCPLHPGQGVFVGASANCGLRLPAKGVADIHCRIEYYEGTVSVQDWMSPSGTRVNGETITGRSHVSVGDLIEIGGHRIAIEHPSSDKTETDLPGQCVVECRDQVGSSVLKETSVTDESHRPGDAEPFWDPATTSMAWDLDPQEGEVGFDDEDVFDRETIALLKAEIEDLRTALSLSDAANLDSEKTGGACEDAEPATDATLRRMQELVDEANRSDERASLLEEILHAAEDTNRSEREERNQLEAWVADIEQRIGQRENEHAAELKALTTRLETSERQRDELHRSIRKNSNSGNAPAHYEEALENLQGNVRSLSDELSESRNHCKSLEQKLEQLSGDQDLALREERAQIAKERARLSRLRFELSSKLTGLESLPKTENHADKEMAHKLQTLRQHLRDIHEQEKREEREAPLATRLAKLWRRVEY